MEKEAELKSYKDHCSLSSLVLPKLVESKSRNNPYGKPVCRLRIIQLNGHCQTDVWHSDSTMGWASISWSIVCHTPSRPLCIQKPHETKYVTNEHLCCIHYLYCLRALAVEDLWFWLTEHLTWSGPQDIHLTLLLTGSFSSYQGYHNIPMTWL